MDKQKKEQAEALRQELKDSYELLEMTTDAQEKKVIEKGIDLLKKEIDELESQEPEKPAEKKKIVKEAVKSKKEKPAKKPEKAPASKKVKPSKKVKTEKQVDKTVKISKVMPDSEKKNVKDILEKEYYKVIMKEVAGKKVKVSVKHTDKVVAKNKIESAFVTVSKKVNSEEEKKKYADDLKVLSSLESVFKKMMEAIYSAFNSHKTEELKKMLNMFNKVKFEDGGIVGETEDSNVKTTEGLHTYSRPITKSKFKESFVRETKPGFPVRKYRSPYYGHQIHENTGSNPYASIDNVNVRFQSLDDAFTYAYYERINKYNDLYERKKMDNYLDWSELWNELRSLDKDFDKQAYSAYTRYHLHQWLNYLKTKTT